MLNSSARRERFSSGPGSDPWLSGQECRPFSTERNILRRWLKHNLTNLKNPSWSSSRKGGIRWGTILSTEEVTLGRGKNDPGGTLKSFSTLTRHWEKTDSEP
jgi:hypothetical protein